MQQDRAQRFWESYVADHIGGIAYSLVQMGSKGKASLPEFKPYSEYVNTSRKKRKTDGMTAQQILDYLVAKL